MIEYLLYGAAIVGGAVFGCIAIASHMETVVNNFKHHIDLDKDFPKFKRYSKEWKKELNAVQREAVERIIPYLPASKHPTAIGIEYAGMSGYFCWLQIGPNIKLKNMRFDDVYTQFRIIVVFNGTYIVLLTNKTLGREHRGYFETGNFEETLVHIQEAIAFDKENSVGIFEHE